MKHTLTFFFIAITCLMFSGCDSPTKNNNTPEPTNYDVMVLVEGGTFLMGNPDSLAPDYQTPVHEISVPAFYIGKYEVTKRSYYTLSNITPPEDVGDLDQPINCINWSDAKKYCNYRSLAEGLTPCYGPETGNKVCDFTANGYRLPTEAEWEFAARGGVRMNDLASSEKNRSSIVAPISDNPNSLGIYSMGSGSYEWCNDWYSETYYQWCYDNNVTVNPLGPDWNLDHSGEDEKVIRDVRTSFAPDSYRIFDRWGIWWGASHHYAGIRVARNSNE